MKKALTKCLVFLNKDYDLRYLLELLIKYWKFEACI